MSQLEEILQREAGSEIEAILAEADARVEQIINDADTKVKALLAEHRQRLEAEAQAASQQARSAARLMVAIACAEVKGEVMDLVRQKALDALPEAAGQPGYGRILQTLAAEALAAAEAAALLVVPPDDGEKLVVWSRDRGLEVQTDAHLRLGVRIECRDGQRITNTLPARLKRAWGFLAPEVGKLLWK